MEQEYQQMADEALARESQGGSLPAFEELVFRYEGRIYAFVNQSCREPMDAREVTQDTFVKAYQAINQYDPGRPFASWLFTIARRKTIDHFRSARVFSDDPLPELVDAHNPAEALAQSEERTGIWEQARRLLPEVQFQALWLKYVEEMSVEQIAKVLHKTQVNVKVLLFRARKTLARKLRMEKQVAVPSMKPARAREIPASEQSSHRALDVCPSRKEFYERMV